MKSSSRVAPLLIAALAVALSSGCGPTTGAQGPEGDADAPGRGQEAIVGGTTDFGDPQVYELYMTSGGACTGALIASRTILTAAHCADGAGDIYVMNATDEKTVPIQDWIKVVDKRVHPGWDPNAQNLANDIALLLLQTAPPVAPKGWNSASIGGLTGQPVRSVGYGITGPNNTDSGIKRQVTTSILQVDTTHFYVGDQVSKGICNGDSGGPTFYTFADGVERVIGVHSYNANSTCTLGGVVRVDYYASFINQWLTEKEGPQCTVDGACKMGCNPIDQDCFCLADAFCDGRCPNLLKDPDCPKDCVANGVCSTQPCPVADVDCVVEGQTCSSELQCKGRLCLKDPQHTNFYCSRPCTTSTECPALMECVNKACLYTQLPEVGYREACTPGGTYCVGNTLCTGPVSTDTRCEAPCLSQEECGPNDACEPGTGGVNYCRDISGASTPKPKQPAVYLTRAKVENVKVAQACAAAGSSPLIALALLSLARMRAGRGRSTDFFQTTERKIFRMPAR